MITNSNYSIFLLVVIIVLVNTLDCFPGCSGCDAPCDAELATLEPSMHGPECSDGFTLDQFVEHLRHKARLGLHTDYMQIKNTPPPGTFESSRLASLEIYRVS